MSVDFAYHGDRHLLRFLASLGPKVEGRVLREALKGPAAEVLKAAKRLAPRGPTGNLRKSLAVSRGRKIKRYSRSRTVLAVCGPQWPLGAHAHLVERGTKLRFTKRKVSRGRMPAQPFMEPAWRSTQAGVARLLRQRIREGLRREIARARAGGR